MIQAEVSAVEHETLQSELAICCRQLQSKDQALRILKQQLDTSQEQVELRRHEAAQLRSQLSRSSSVLHEDMVEEKERFIVQLEECQERMSDLERRLQMEEDEKEEVMGEKDYFSSRCSALMKCLEEKENAKPPSQCALQTLAEENRQLKLQLVEVQAERDRAQARIERYKRAMNRRKSEEAGEFQFCSPMKHNSLRHAMKQITELESLANNLSETVKEKSIALTHQKKANKMLGTRVAELEHRLKVLEISGLWSSSDGLVSDLVWSVDSTNREMPKLLSPERTFIPSLYTKHPPNAAVVHSTRPADHRSPGHPSQDHRPIANHSSPSPPPQSHSSPIHSPPSSPLTTHSPPSRKSLLTALGCVLPSDPTAPPNVPSARSANQQNGGGRGGGGGGVKSRRVEGVGGKEGEQIGTTGVVTPTVLA